MNNHELEESILGNLAKCQERHGVKLYAFAIEGTHKHELALFPECNRSLFFRDFNSDVARSVQRHCKAFKGGNLWGRRYSNEFVVRDEDIEAQFFYTVLQPVQDGLVESIDLYPGYNCFYDAIRGVEREFRVIDWAKYNAEKRWKKKIEINDYTTFYRLRYERLPGYEKYSQKEYEQLMIKKLKERTKEIVKERKRSGRGFLGVKKLVRAIPGVAAKNPKVSDSRWSFRPRILSACAKERDKFLRWYFDMLFSYYDASYAYRIECVSEPDFPPGMYKPPCFTISYKLAHEDLALAA